MREEIRKRVGLSLQAVARLARVPATAVLRWERGEEANERLDGVYVALEALLKEVA